MPELTLTTIAPLTSDSVHPSLWERLAAYQMVPQLIKELIIDTAIAEIDCPQTQIQEILQEFYLMQRITSEEIKQNWLRHYRMSPKQLEHQAIRQWKIEQYKQQKWASRIETLFLAQKGQFDQVVYSLLRTKNREVAQELFFRLQEGEQTFAKLATDYSQGPEAQTGGLVGPIEMSRLQPPIAQLLQQRQPGKLYPPVRLEQWFIILRLEKRIPAPLTDILRKRLIEQQYQEWLQQEMAQFDVATLTTQLSANGNIPVTHP